MVELELKYVCTYMKGHDEWRKGERMMEGKVILSYLEQNIYDPIVKAI